MLKEKDDLSWYARKAARALIPAAERPDPAFEKRLAALLGGLRAAGIKGDAGTLTLFTKTLPPGCVRCLKGRGTNLYVTGFCTRDCFFCFNHKPRKDELVVHGIPVDTPAEALEVVERFGLTSVGISGGEPLMFPERVLALIAALRSSPRDLRVELYTNGDRADERLLRLLRDAGLDALRVNLAARGYDSSPVRAALKWIPEVAVEIPVIPAELQRQKNLVIELDVMGVPFLNLHELFVSPENRERMLREGHAPVDRGYERLMWQPVAESGVAALELLLFAAEHARNLSVYYCSCGTQETISRRGLARRRAAAGRCAAPAA